MSDNRKKQMNIKEFNAPKDLKDKVMRNFHLVETLGDVAKIFTIAPKEYFNDNKDRESH